VLLLAGFISVAIGAIYLRRTNNYKRLLTYSTVENMGIVLIGLGVGGVGAFAALFHMLIHSLLKSGMFAQIAQVGRLYGTYRINRAGDYLNLYPIGGITVLLGMVGLLAFPPSGFFVSEVLILKELMFESHWVLLTVFVLLSCLIIYTLARRFSGLILRPSDTSRTNRAAISLLSTGFQLGLIGLALVAGIWQPRFLIEFLNVIIG
jgi:hydrogenase-4 component F